MVLNTFFCLSGSNSKPSPEHRRDILQQNHQNSKRNCRYMLGEAEGHQCHYMPEQTRGFHVCNGVWVTTYNLACCKTPRRFLMGMKFPGWLSTGETGFILPARHQRWHGLLLPACKGRVGSCSARYRSSAYMTSNFNSRIQIDWLCARYIFFIHCWHHFFIWDVTCWKQIVRMCCGIQELAPNHLRCRPIFSSGWPWQAQVLLLAAQQANKVTW